MRLTGAGEQRLEAATRWRAAQNAFEGGYGAKAAERLRKELARVVATM